MKFHVIGDEETVLGFQLAGVDGEVVSEPDETRAALERVFSMEDMGIIIIPERIASTVRKSVDQYIYKKSFPLIIEIPDRFGPKEDRGSVRDLIREAVGIHL